MCSRAPTVTKAAALKHLVLDQQELQSAIKSDIQIASGKVNRVAEATKQLCTEVRRVELEAEQVQNFESWIDMSSNSLAQLKRQIVCLHKELYVQGKAGPMK